MKSMKLLPRYGQLHSGGSSWEARPWPGPPQLSGDKSQCAQLLPSASTLSCNSICTITLVLLLQILWGTRWALTNTSALLGPEYT